MKGAATMSIRLCLSPIAQDSVIHSRTTFIKKREEPHPKKSRKLKIAVG
jgi:hypothetical protein